MTNPQPWTQTQFQAAMRAAGWKLDSKAGAYTHKVTGRIYNPFNWLAETGADWLKWAAARQTPPDGE